MTWWLVPSILGVVLVGIVVGLLVSRQVLKAKKESFPFFRKQNIVDIGISGKYSGFAVTGPAVNLTVQDQSLERKNRVNLPGDDNLQVYRNAGKSSPAVKTPLSPALVELQNNLSIAARPVTDNLINFKLDIWRTRRSEFNVVSNDLMEELKEAYVDMTLANNIVWLVNELGRDTQNLKDSYIKLCNKVSERLERIMPAARNCFK
jgi:hypothetical protein